MQPTLHRALCLLLLLCAITLGAPGQAANFGHQAWTTENGLPQNSVHAIFQSRDGYLWIATEGGIARFDGLEFHVFQRENTPAITSDDVCCFAQTSDNAIWIGTADGLLRYQSGGFHRYATTDGLPSPDILALVPGSTSLYVLTGDGVAQFHDNIFSLLTLPSSPLAIIPNADDGVLIATPEGLMQYGRGNLSRSYVQLPPSIEALQAFGYMPGRTLWRRTRSSLTFTASGASRTIDSRLLNGAHIQSFLPSTRGALWIGTSKGLYYLSDVASAPRLEPELGTDSVLSLLEDIEGNLWIGTETSGLHILRHRNFRTLPALNDRSITAIARTNNGTMWLGSNGEGIDSWLNGETHHLAAQNGLLSDVILALAPGRGNDLWIGTADGLNHLDGHRIDKLTSADGLPDDFVRSLLLDANNTLWVGTRRGLAHLHDHTVTTLTHADGLGSDLIGAMVQPSGSTDLWIATLNGLSLLRNGSVKTFTTSNGISGNVITSLFYDASGNLWIGTRGSGLSLRTSDGRFLALRRSDLPQTIDSILGDDMGSLWLSSPRGITRASILELLTCASSPTCDLHLHHYGVTDGMPTEETSAIGHPSAWKTAEGPLWFATRKGVAIVDPAHLFRNTVPPPVVIQRFTVDDTEQPNEARIPPGHTRFSFEYAGLSFVAPSRVRYRYQLEGFDKQWTDAGTRRTAYYTNLPPGSYRFSVQAANNDGVWNQAGTQLAFTVRPPFYRTLWFLLFAAALLAALAALLYRLRLRRLQSQFSVVLAERTRVAREIHDTLAQSFVGVSVQLELATQLLAHQQVDAARQQLDRTTAYVREGIAEARRSIWDLRAATAENTLPTRLSRLAEQYTSDGLALDLNIGGTYRSLDDATENEILRIAQESLTNIQRHAQTDFANIELRYDPTILTLVIADKGRGFSLTQAEAAHNHFGLKGMYERASQIGATLDVISAPDQGTRITLKLPLAPEKGDPSHG